MSSPIKLEIEGKKYVAYPEQSETENKSLRPKQGEEIFYIRCNSKSVGQHSYDTDGSMPSWYELGDVFKTEQEAERELAYRQALQRVKEWIYEHDAKDNDEEALPYITIVWNATEERFHYLRSDYKSFSPFGYLKSEKACEQLIREKSDDLKIIFNV